MIANEWTILNKEIFSNLTFSSLRSSTNCVRVTRLSNVDVSIGGQSGAPIYDSFTSPEI